MGGVRSKHAAQMLLAEDQPSVGHGRAPNPINVHPQ
jgi:hypothetical protein